ncbi:MAG: proteasome subunit alpha [Acidimicrobiales bacterium]|nr:proteasome subunit alpha [Acidimicrobiales bacterium]|tara:strand:- start:604 stop:1284 length:681 start_codon:yes stop_codon:yes gene_type:complete
MAMPGMYVSPEQLMQDRADYARKGISRGRSLAAVEHQGGIALVAENASSTLRKVSEIYDRIAFGGVGRYNEFDQLRIAGVRYAELKGYQYSREDVDARSLANQYAQMLGQIFTHEMKPMEVEIVVAEIDSDGTPELYRIQYDGTVADEQHWCCIGGDSEAVRDRLSDGWSQELDRDAAVRLAVQALAGPDRSISADELEVAVLAAGNGRRCFRRLDDAETEGLLAD